MKTNSLKAAAILVAACVTTFTSCKKEEDLALTGKNPAKDSKGITITYEIRSNEGYRHGIEDPGYTFLYRNTYGAAYIADIRLSIYSDPAGMNGYGESEDVGVTAITYNDASTHVPTLYFLSSPTSGVPGVPFTIQYGGTNMNVDEIEVNPADGQVYALANHLSTKALYKLVPNTTTGIAEATWVGELFHSFAINGYAGGSIAFVQDQSTAVWYLSFTNESTVYSASGVGQWNYALTYGATTTIATDPSHPNCYYTGIANPLTGKLNSVSLNGNLYVARDNETLYLLVPAVGGGSSSVTSIGTIAASHDFGPNYQFTFTHFPPHL